MPDENTTISDVIAAAGQPGHAHVKAVMGEASAWLAVEAANYGLDIAGFLHSFETGAARHIHAKHGNSQAEARRGQIAVTSDDLIRIPELLTAPDKIVFGSKGRRNQHIIAYIKKLPACTAMYLQEVCNGRRELATISMRKYPATIDAITIAGTLDPNGRTDGRDRLYIVDVPPNVTAIVESPTRLPATIDAGGDAQTVVKTPPPATHPILRRVLHYLPPVLGLLVLTGIIFGLHRALKHVSLRDVLAALTATPGAEIAHALGLLGLSFCIMVIYDIPGILFAKKLFDFPRMGMRRIGLASFSAYSLSHVVGAPAISAAAIRFRLYAQWGVPAAGIGRIVALSGTTFALGTAALLGGVLLLRPLDVPLLGHDVTPLALRGVGAGLWLLVLAYVLAARSEKPLRVLGKNIPRPGLGLAIAQVLLSCADTGTACAILYVVLPTVPGLTYAHVLAIYLAGFAGGLFSGLPGGVGVFDTVLLLGLAGYMDPARAIGAILLFRVVYYLAPAALGGLCFAGHEIWINVRRKR
jgi:uncharacterized membrane protein YbhN (UPF0104 family)